MEIETYLEQKSARDSERKNDRSERGVLLAQAKEIYNRVKGEKRDMTKAEINKFDELLDHVEFIDQRKTGTRPDPSDTTYGGSYYTTSDKSVSYRKLFGSNNDTGGFTSFADFVRTLTMNPADQRLSNRIQVVGVPADGGFAVPEPYSAFLVDTALQGSILFDKVQTYPMTSQTLKVPAWSDTTHASSVNGFTGRWLSEATAQTAQTAHIRMLELSTKKIGIYCIVSSELLTDSPGFEMQLTQKMTEAVQFYVDQAILNGLGGGTPLGIMNSPSLITQPIVAGQTSGVLFENLVGIWSRLMPGSQKNAVWICSPSVLPELFGLGIVIGMGGASVYMPVGGLSATPNGTLFGRPLLVTEHAAALNSVGDLILTDPTKYVLGLRSGLQLAKSGDIGFAADTIAYRLILRCDGMPAFATPLTLRDGVTTTAPTVCLAVRP